MGFLFLWFRNNLRKNRSLKICSFIISLSFALVVAALIFTRSMINGMQDRLAYLSSGHIRLNSTESVEIEGTSYEKVISGYAMIYSADSSSEILIKGVSDGYLDSRNRYLKISEINDSKKFVVISKELSENLNVGYGDYIALMLIPDSSSKTIRPDVCKIGGIYDSGYSEVDSNIIFTSIDYAASMFPSDESISFEYLIIDYSEKRINEVKREMSGLDIVDWRTANYNVYSNFETSSNAIILILYILIIFSSFLTLSFTQQIVNDRKKDIAVTKLLGATHSQLILNITFTVLFAVILFMSAGTVLGVILGTNLSSVLNYFISDSDAFRNYLLDFDIIIPWKTVFILFLSELLISFIFILISSLKSKKITPILLFR